MGYALLKKHFAKLHHLSHLQAIAGWDEAVIMPAGGGNDRAAALSELSGLMHEQLTQPQVGEWIAQAKATTLENSWDQANLAWMEKRYINATCLPSELVANTTQASIACEQAWRQLRAENNWADFAPLLETTLNYVKEAAAIRSEQFNRDPYDILIDDFSPGFNQANIDPIFTELKSALPNLIEKITHKQQSESVTPPTGPFPVENQRQLGLELMQALGFDFNHGRLDVSHHPFCGGVPSDVRITTRYNEQEFVSAAMGVCHETGHARYEQNLPQAWLDQPVGVALGMAVHESQSLLVEMQACRSHEFLQFATPLIKNQFGNQEAFTPNNLFRLYTRVNPGLIRVDADEVTYPLHVILRYELEKQLIADTLAVKDLPDAWHAGMQQYLGLSTKGDDQNGVMQDVHWPSGAFGYFPAYTLGSLIAAQLFATATAKLPDLPNEISNGQFNTLFTWLNQHIHARASSTTTDQLLIDATGETLNPQFFLTHVQNRYL